MGKNETAGTVKRPMLRPKVLAEAVGVNKKTILRAFDEGRIRGIRVGKRGQVRIHPEELDRILAHGF